MSGVVVLGATGSIGRQALEVTADEAIPVVALAARRGGTDFMALAEAHPDAALAVAEPDDPADLTDRFGGRVAFGPEAVVELAAIPGTTVVNGVVGAAGLRASLAAARAGNRLGLANKESLVAAGPLVTAAVAAGGGELFPIDSEHSAIHQCLLGEPPEAVRRLILTASGGPFRGRRLADLADVTAEEALAHPTWRMGPRITIDSATLVNKGLEVIEAHHLFGVDFDRIDVVVHPQSIVHSLVEFVDGSLKAHLGEPDMRVPIRYALTAPNRGEAPSAFSLPGLELTFEEPDTDAFPALRLAFEAGRAGGGAPAAFNAADEVAVAAFLAGRIAFTDIPGVIASVLDRLGAPPIPDVAAVDAVDAAARRLADAAIGP
ncbi:MAG: 1-deoxy-D-xylulose-5-phosphate reductoisomerase [Acidimicrobiia bacterium]